MRKSEITASEGVVHIHTSFSRDGDMAPRELMAFCRDFSLSFACITDHAEDMTGADMAHLVSSCDELSDGEFSMIPGLEFALDETTHVIALGLRSRPGDIKAPDLLAMLKAQGAVLVLAHPLAFNVEPGPSVLDIVDGIEIWNHGHDGGFFPNPRVVGYFNRMVRAFPHLVAFGGEDLHRKEEKVKVRTVLNGPVSSIGITDSLRKGAFGVRGGLWEMTSCPSFDLKTAAALVTSYGAYRSVKRVRDLFTVDPAVEGSR